MLKALLKYLLPSFILLLIGFSLNNPNQINTVKTNPKLENAILSSAQSSLNFSVKLVSSEKEKENCDLNTLLVFDDDDDEFISFKRNLDYNNYSISSFSQKPVYSFNCEGVFFANKPIHSIASNKHCMFEVFRI